MADSKLETRLNRLNMESKQITQGPIKRRLLDTCRQNIDQHGNIRRWSFGVMNPQNKIRTVMVMGETGTGKTTLINVMTNYVLGVEWNDKIRYEIVEEEEKKMDQTQSQTSKVTIYEIFGCEGVRVPFSLKVIDTPGYGDTKGEGMDKRIAENLCHLFECEGGVHQIDAVCIVVKASQNRLTPTQRYIFDAVLSLFGQDMRNNIVALITFSGPGKPAALAAIDKAGVPCSRDKMNNPVHFKFDNLPEEQCDDDTLYDFESTWEKGKRSMQAFFEYLNTLETRSLVMTSKVLIKREELECCMKSLREQIERAEGLQRQIKETQDALEMHKQDIENNKNFEYVVTEEHIEKVKSETEATCCEKCKFTCHYPCTFYKLNLSWCAVMTKSQCIACPDKCSYTAHLNEKKRYVREMKKVTKTYDKLKEKYEKACGEEVTLESLKKRLQEDLHKTEKEKQVFISESFDHVITLSKISLRPESFSMLQHLDFLIERLQETAQLERVQQLQDLKKKAMEAHKLEGEEQSVMAKLKFFLGSN